MPTQNKYQQRKSYPSDLSDAQWAKIELLLPKAKSNQATGGRPRTTNLREVINAMLYLVRSGCAWRMLPHDLPDWKIVHHYFDAWQKDGTWEQLHDVLHTEARLKAGKKPHPSAGILDAQSVQTTKKGEFVALMPVRR